jgi:hypothetical protein
MVRRMTSSRCATVVLLLFQCLPGWPWPPTPPPPSSGRRTDPEPLSRRLLGEGRRCAPPPVPSRSFRRVTAARAVVPVASRHHFSRAIVPHHLSFTSVPGPQLSSMSSTARPPSSSRSAPEPPPHELDPELRCVELRSHAAPPFSIRWRCCRVRATATPSFSPPL